MKKTCFVVLSSPDPFVVVSNNNTSQVYTGIRTDLQINLNCIETGKKEGGER